MRRRTFLKNTALAGATTILPWQLSGYSKNAEKIRFGIIADVHQDIMHDGVDRLQAFVSASSKRAMDFIIQIGDFCRPYDYNLPFMDVWNKFDGPKYHVLGNHDMDGGFTREQTMEYWKMAAKYYSFDASGYHFIVLDGNDQNPSPSWTGYSRYMETIQLEWLKNDLANTSLNTFIFSHQSLENEEGVENNLEVRKILEQANKTAGFTKIVACLSGHHHTDYQVKINDIYYVQINSASYRWVGDNFLHQRYSQEIDEKYPFIKYTIPYRDPLYAFVEINPKGFLTIEGSKTEYVGIGPEEMNMPARPENDPIASKISDVNVRF